MPFLKRDRLPAYITGEQFVANQERLLDDSFQKPVSDNEEQRCSDLHEPSQPSRERQPEGDAQRAGNVRLLVLQNRTRIDDQTGRHRRVEFLRGEGTWVRDLAP